MSIYMDLIEAVKNGKKFKVDLIHKSLWINKKQIIEKRVVLNEATKLIEPQDSAMFTPERELLFNEYPWTWVERLYTMYKRSAPSENSNNRSYFQALPLDELTDVDLAYNPDRNFMQAVLEGYVLLASLQGWLRWEFDNNWFWQCPSDKNLVVMKNWIE